MDRMVDPHTTMSLAAVLVLTVVVLVTVGGWLAVVFRAGSGSGPVGRRAHGSVGGTRRAADTGTGSLGQAEAAVQDAGNPA
jgi:hypothetical protein